MSAPLPVGVTGLPVDMIRPDDTYGTVTYGPSAVAALALPLIALSDGEQAIVTRLQNMIETKRYRLQLLNAYYEGQNRIQDLGISIPPQMRNLHIALGWPRVAVEAMHLRLSVDGFLYPDSTDVDEQLQEIWLANDMDAEHGLGILDSLVFGYGYLAAGSAPAGPNVVDRPPLITVESPLDIAVEWDARTREMTAALRMYDYEGSRQATLYLPDQTVPLIMTRGGWTVLDRDQHRLGTVLMERIVNRGRSYARDGASEITPELMSLTDQGCRMLMGMAVASEFYSAPQRYVLGAQESAFVDADGNAKSAWQTYIGRVWALEPDENGNLPSVGQFPAYDPSPFSKGIDTLAQRVSAITGIPPYSLGFTTANPTSADAIRSGETTLTRRADHKTLVMGKPFRNIMKKTLLLRGGPLPPKIDQLTTLWAATATPTPGATTDAVFKQVTMGYLPATSDVTGEELGYSAAQRRRIEADRATDAGASFLDEIAHSIGAKDARVDRSLASYIGGPNPDTGHLTVNTQPNQPPAAPNGPAAK